MIAGTSTTSVNALRPAALAASCSSNPRSARISSCAFGRCTLTTTRSPPTRIARCTCAIVPAAIGCGSMLVNTSSHGTRSSRSITATTSRSLSGVTWSWRADSSRTNAGGRRSGRVERIWPNLENVGPSSSSARRNRCARASSLDSRSSPESNRLLSPYLARTAAIRAARPSSWPSVGSTSPSPPAGRARGVRPLPSAVFTMTTVHGAVCETRLGTLPSRNSVRSLMLRLPTTTMSACSSSATCTIASAGCESYSILARPRVPARRSASSDSSDSAAP